MHDVGRGSLHLQSPIWAARQWTCGHALPKSRAVMRQFHKMHGLGNDFVILDARTDPVTMTPELARALADRQPASAATR